MSYDLRAPGRDYAALYDLLKEQRAWCRVTESHWLIESTDTAATIRDKIGDVIDENDEVSVITIMVPTWWATRNLGKERNDWIRSRLGD
ncbi:MAG: hypothetical protein OXH07_00515 [Chloroflexi bacterium]|nr:hypothetical protein [Chloroflexota bacterium]